MDPSQPSKRKQSQSQPASPGQQPPKKISKTTDSSENFSVTPQIEFEPRSGDHQGAQEFAHLSTEDQKINLFISGKPFADVIKKSPKIDLDENSTLNIDRVIDVTGLATMGNGLDKNLVGLFSGAHALNDIIEKSSAEGAGSTAVLVHCTKGYERSVSTVLLYLMGYQGYSNEHASEVLNKALELGREEGKRDFFKQSKDSNSSHNAKIAETFNHIVQGEMKSRMNNTVELAEFFLSKSSSEKTLENAYEKDSKNPLEIKIRVPVGLGGKSNMDALIKVLQGTRIEKALTKQETLADFRTYQQQQSSAGSTAEKPAEKLDASTESKIEAAHEQPTIVHSAGSASMNSVAAQGSKLADKIKESKEQSQASESPEISESGTSKPTFPSP